jgi:hypothetical protein
MQRALAHAGKASAVERAMIQALTARYPQREAIEDTVPWDKAYTREMREVFAAFPDDIEVCAVFAEAIMNETPWQMWDLPSGTTAERAGTEECMAARNTLSTDSRLHGITRACCISMSTLYRDVALSAAGTAGR